MLSLFPFSAIVSSRRRHNIITSRQIRQATWRQCVLNFSVGTGSALQPCQSTPVQAAVDGMEAIHVGETFNGTMSYIADRAQFSSRDTQACEDRANVVFAVKIRMPNPDHRLKAGMTADATIELRP